MSSHHDQIQDLAKRLEEWDYKIDRLAHRIQGLPEELKGKAVEKFNQLKEIRSKLLATEEAMKDASEKAVHEIEDSLEEAWDTIKVLVEEVELDVNVNPS